MHLAEELRKPGKTLDGSLPVLGEGRVLGFYAMQAAVDCLAPIIYRA